MVTLNNPFIPTVCETKFRANTAFQPFPLQKKQIFPHAQRANSRTQRCRRLRAWITPAFRHDPEFFQRTTRLSWDLYPQTACGWKYFVWAPDQLKATAEMGQQLMSVELLTELVTGTFTLALAGCHTSQDTETKYLDGSLVEVMLVFQVQLSSTV